MLSTWLRQTYAAGGAIRISTESKQPSTISSGKDEARSSLQKDVAKRIGVGKTSIFNGEANISQPDPRYMPAVIRLLGYNPLPALNTLTEKIVRHRTALGMTQKEAAQSMAVDASTLARWERRQRKPAGDDFAEAVCDYLEGQHESPRTRRGRF